MNTNEVWILIFKILIIIGAIYGIVVGIIYILISTLFKTVYSSTNNLFVTITIVGAVIFFGIGLFISTTPESYGGNKGFMESGGLYYIISGVLFLISFIIIFFSKRSTPRINTSRINTSRLSTGRKI
jgi:hypothetical protein